MVVDCYTSTTWGWRLVIEWIGVQASLLPMTARGKKWFSLAVTSVYYRDECVQVWVQDRAYFAV